MCMGVNATHKYAALYKRAIYAYGISFKQCMDTCAFLPKDISIMTPNFRYQ